MSKTFVYYDPDFDMICLRNEYGSTCFGTQFFDSGATCLWSALWDEYCENNFILLGEL